MDLNINLPDLRKLFPRSSFLNLQFPFVLLSALFRRVLLVLVHLVGSIANSVAILICYLYLKNFRRHSIIIVDGYISIFKTFAEFISAVSCLCFGLMEVDIFYTILGIVGIAMGLLMKALLLYRQHQSPNQTQKAFIYCFSAIYIICVLACSFAFHAVAIKTGVVPCVTRIVTCTVPLVALSECFRTSGPQGRYFAYLADFVAVVVLWWYCSHLSLKYFVLMPSVVGLVFSFIQYVLVEIQRVTSKEVESDIYLK